MFTALLISLSTYELYNAGERHIGTFNRPREVVNIRKSSNDDKSPQIRRLEAVSISLVSRTSQGCRAS